MHIYSDVAPIPFVSTDSFIFLMAGIIIAAAALIIILVLAKKRKNHDSD